MILIAFMLAVVSMIGIAEGYPEVVLIWLVLPLIVFAAEYGEAWAKYQSQNDGGGEDARTS